MPHTFSVTRKPPLANIYENKVDAEYIAEYDIFITAFFGRFANTVVEHTKS